MKENTLDVTEQSKVFEFMSIGEIVNQTLQKNVKEESTPTNGLSTGFNEIDRVISGLKNGQLVTVAVRPGMGKTAFLLSLTNNIAIKNNHSVAIFSSERSNQKITNRIIESETGMSIEKLRSGEVIENENDQLHAIISNIAKAKIYLDDTPSLSVEELVKKSRQLKFFNSVDLIIIDYLELLSTNDVEADSREEQLNNIVHTVKEIAKELNVPIVLFSQIQGQGFGYNSFRKPAIKDIPVFLSELSDVVMFLHRTDLMGQSCHIKEKVEMIIAKYDNQNHNTSVPLRYIESMAKFAST